MTAVDPNKIGKYIPRDAAPIAEAQEVVFQAFDLLVGTHVGMISYEEHNEKVYESMQGRHDYEWPLLPSEEELQIQCWEYVRHELVTGFVRAFTVDSEGALHGIDPSFWVTEFAGVAFASGSLPSTPKYDHGGIIVLPSRHVSGLFGKYLEYFVEKYWLTPEEKIEHHSKPQQIEGSAPVLRLTSGGRPSLYDGEEFLLHAMALMRDETDSPATQAELARRAIDAYERAAGPGGRPSMPWAKSRIRRLWAVLKEDNNG